MTRVMLIGLGQVVAIIGHIRRAQAAAGAGHISQGTSL